MVCNKCVSMTPTGISARQPLFASRLTGKSLSGTAGLSEVGVMVPA